jgi:predicted dehydrogenase
LKQRIIGDLLHFDAYAYSSDFYGVQRSSASTARGGVLEDLGSHVVDLSLWYFEEFFASYKVSKSSSNSYDSVDFSVEGSEGLVGRFRISWVQQGYRMPEFGLIIYGKKGTIEVDDNSLILTQKDKERETYFRQDLDDHVPFYLGDSEYFREDNHFINSILNNSHPEPSFRTAKKVDYLLDKVRIT